MRFKNCGCPCQNCLTSANSCIGICADIADKIILAGPDGDGNFIIKIRRKRTLDSNGSPNPSPFIYFSICIPMVNGIGYKHFSSPSETPTDCYAFIREYECGNDVKYYFWITTDVNSIEPPFEHIDKTNYLYIYTNTNGGEIYYLSQTGYDDPITFMIPSTMNVLIPYIFWACPSLIKLDLTFPDDEYFTAGWCNHTNGQYTQSVNLPLSTFNGSYLVNLTQFSIENQKQCLDYLSSNLIDSDEILAGVGKLCGIPCASCSMNYYDVDFSINMRINIINWNIIISMSGSAIQSNTAIIVGGAGAITRFHIGFDNFQIGDDCVDQRILDGDYGLAEYTETYSNTGMTCNTIPTSSCSLQMSISPPIPEIDVTVLTWSILNACT